MTDAPELLPCPFCGDAMQFGKTETVTHVSQGRCIIGSMGFVSVSAWNTRADLARPVTVAEAAKVLTEDGFFEPAVAITESLRNAGYIVPMTRVRTALRALSHEGGE